MSSSEVKMYRQKESGVLTKSPKKQIKWLHVFDDNFGRLIFCICSWKHVVYPTIQTALWYRKAIYIHLHVSPYTASRPSLPEKRLDISKTGPKYLRNFMRARTACRVITNVFSGFRPLLGPYTAQEFHVTRAFGCDCVHRSFTLFHDEWSVSVVGTEYWFSYIADLQGIICNTDSD